MFISQQKQLALKSFAIIHKNPLALIYEDVSPFYSLIVSYPIYSKVLYLASSDLLNSHLATPTNCYAVSHLVTIFFSFGNYLPPKNTKSCSVATDMHLTNVSSLGNAYSLLLFYFLTKRLLVYINYRLSWCTQFWKATSKNIKKPSLLFIFLLK